MPLIIRQSFGQVRLFFLFVVLALLGHQAHQNLLKSFESEELPLFVETLPNEEYVRFQWLNFKELAGDYYWLRVVSHFGDTRAQAVDYPLLLKLLKLVTTLKPHFRPAYELAGVALPMVEGYVDGAIDILEKGVQEFPEEWRIVHLKAYIHYMEKGEYAEAAELYARVAHLPNVPEWVPGLGQRLAVEGGNPEVGLAIIDHLIADNEDERILEHFKERRRLILMEIRMKTIQDWVHRYSQEIGIFPDSFQELMSWMGKPFELDDGVGGTFKLSANGRVSTTSEEKRLRPFGLDKHK